jgi:signal transduction histidine kinase
VPGPAAPIVESAEAPAVEAPAVEAPAVVAPAGVAPARDRTEASSRAPADPMLRWRAPARGPFARIARSWHAMTSVIRNASEFAKLDGGEVRLRFTDAPVVPLLDEIRRRYVPRTYARGLIFHCATCPGSVFIRADAARVRRVLEHLIENAIKYTAPGGRITVECDANGQAVRIRVRDTGRGIPAAWLAEVFEPYVQVDAHRTPIWRRGLGLGLTISQRWATAMGGALDVESEPGVGSTFTLTLLRG